MGYKRGIERPPPLHSTKGAREDSVAQGPCISKEQVNAN